MTLSTKWQGNNLFLTEEGITVIVFVFQLGTDWNYSINGKRSARSYPDADTAKNAVEIQLFHAMRGIQEQLG